MILGGLGSEGYRNLIPSLELILGFFYGLPGNGAGGFLHIVLDDGNLGTDSIWACRENLQDDDTLGLLIINILLEMTETERQYAWENGWIYDGNGVIKRANE